MGWKLTFCLLGFLFIEGSVISADFPQRKIGVEIETSYLKIQHSGEIIRFSVSDKKKKTKLWILEPDTLDQMLPSDDGLYNLELKTYGGFSDHNDFFKTLISMTFFIIGIYNSSDDVTLKDLFSSINSEVYDVEQMGNGEPKIIKKGKEGYIRPQITYQVPLNMIPAVFERLASFKHKISSNISDFFDSLNNKNFKCDDILKSKLLFIENRNKINHILRLFNEIFCRNEKNKTMSKNVKGFTYLFLYYWAYLFNDNKILSTELEPGLKTYLSIMPRIPLSELYDHEMNAKEKEEFKSLFEDLISRVGNNYKLREYLNARSQKISSQLTLKNWYMNITNQGKSGLDERQTVKKKIDDTHWIEHQVDRLSPPPEIDHHNSMGLFLWEFAKNPLIEVRGYANIFNTRAGMFQRKDGKPEFITFIQNIKKLITEESKWFFDVKE